VLENDYVRVSRDEAPCGPAGTPGCAERVIVAMGEISCARKVLRAMRRGEVAVFRPANLPSAGGGPPISRSRSTDRRRSNAPPRSFPPRKYDRVRGERFFIYEERLAPGDTRERHSHSQRVEIRINQGPLLRQIIDGKDSPAGTAERGELTRADHSHGHQCRRHGAVEFHSRVQAGALIALTLKKPPTEGDEDEAFVFRRFRLGVLKGDTVVDVSKNGERHSAHRPPHDLRSTADERSPICRKKLEKARRAAAASRSRG